MLDKKEKEIGLVRAESRYIMFNEDIFEALDGYELKVYMALRYEADYSKEESSTKRTIDFIVKKSGVSRRKVFMILNDLEFKYFLIQRLNPDEVGVARIYNVSRTLFYFKTRAHDALPRAHDAHPPCTTCIPKESLSLSLSLPVPEAPPPEIKTFKTWANRNGIPKLNSVTPKTISTLNKAKETLKQHDATIEDYLHFLESRCSSFLEPYVSNGKERQHNFYSLLRPGNIKKAIEQNKFTNKDM